MSSSTFRYVRSLSSNYSIVMSSDFYSVDIRGQNISNYFSSNYSIDSGFTIKWPLSSKRVINLIISFSYFCSTISTDLFITLSNDLFKELLKFCNSLIYPEPLSWNFCFRGLMLGLLVRDMKVFLLLVVLGWNYKT